MSLALVWKKWPKVCDEGGGLKSGRDIGRKVRG